MEWVETTGRTVAEALDAALDELGVDDDEVEYEVIDEPRGGLLRREARIRARVRPVSREKPGDRRRRTQRRESSRGGREKAAATPRTGNKVAVAAESEGSRSGSGTRRRRRGGRGRGAGRTGASRSDGTDETTRGEGTVDEEFEVSLEEQAAAAEEFTRGIVDAFELGATTVARIEDEGVLVDVTGQELGLLVGPKGATLQAIEELVRTAVQRQTEGHGARINVDVAGYRAKRREALGKFALGVAEQVKESGDEQALEPMSASDRKVVHDAIAELDGVTTLSEGEEPRRRVVVRRA